MSRTFLEVALFETTLIYSFFFFVGFHMSLNHTNSFYIIIKHLLAATGLCVALFRTKLHYRYALGNQGKRCQSTVLPHTLGLLNMQSQA